MKKKITPLQGYNGPNKGETFLSFYGVDEYFELNWVKPGSN